MNSTLGFTESFSATRYCRFCYADKSICECLSVERLDLIRKIENYERDVKLNNMKLTGLKESCIFHKFEWFHVYVNLTVDVMHDLFEGICSYTLSRIIDWLIKQGIIDLETLNNRIKSFLFNDTEKKNRPMPVLQQYSKKGEIKIKLKQSSAEMLCLTRYFGLIVGDKIINPGPHWELYGYLRSLVGLLSKPEMSEDEIDLVQYFAEKHNSLYFELFGKLKPKMHLLLHYPRVIRANGPVIHYSSLKFERQNKTMKDFIIGTSSNVQLPFTMATRNQLNFCHKLMFSSWTSPEIELGPLNDKNPDENFLTFRNVIIWNKTYSPGTICVTRYTSDGPVFGKIIKISLRDETAVLEIKEFTTLFFSTHYQAYRVIIEEEVEVVPVKVSLIPKLPPCLHAKIFEEDYVATRYKLS